MAAFSVDATDAYVMFAETGAFMHKFLKAVGAVLFFGPLVVLCLIAANNGGAAINLAMILTAMPALVGGALLMAFAQMVDHLEAIRASSERQADMLTKLLERRQAAGQP